MGLNIGGIIGGIVGSMLGIPGGAALGAGLGAKATGASDKEAMMYGLGGLMLGGGGAGKAGGYLVNIWQWRDHGWFVWAKTRLAMLC
jgi:hypothetical protein